MAFQILLHIPSDRDFLSALRTSKQMRSIASHQRIWKERLEFHYPQHLELHLQTGLDWKKFYPIASLLSQIYCNRLTKHREGWINSLVIHILNSELELDLNLIIQKLAHIPDEEHTFKKFLSWRYDELYIKSEKVFLQLLNIVQFDTHYIYKVAPFFIYHDPKILFDFRCGDRTAIRNTVWIILSSERLWNVQFTHFVNRFMELYYSTFSEPYNADEKATLIYTIYHFRMDD